MTTLEHGACAVCGGNMISERCGEQWLSDDTTQKLEQLAADARAWGAELAVITLDAA